MAATEATTRRFCTTCGSPLIDGECSRGCAEPTPSPQPQASPARQNQNDAARPARRRIQATGAIIAFLVLLALVSAVFAHSLSVANDVATTNRALDDLHTELGSTTAALDDALAARAALLQRVRALEAELSESPDTASTAKSTAGSVFTVVSGRGSGSGFVVKASAGTSWVVTNFHVVSDGYLNGDRSVEVTRGNLTYPGEVVDASESNDLAVIRVRRALPALTLVKERPAIGDAVLVLGSPLGLGGTVTSGIVSSFRQYEGLAYLQFSAPISPGNSGGPVVDADGRVVGVAVFKAVGSGAEGLGFAIPTGRMCSSLEVC